MRVLHVISTIDAQAGGTTSALVTLATAQASAGLNVTVASTFCEGDDTQAADEMKREQVRVELIGPAAGKLRRHPEIGGRIPALVREAEIVHIHTLWEEILHVAARAAHSQGRRYIISPHGMLDPWSLSQSRWVKRVYMAWRLRRNLNRASALHFTSEIERDLVGGLKLKPPGVIIPNGLRMDEFDPLPARGAFRERFEKIGDRRLILFLGRLHPKKGLALLIPAFARANLGDAVLAIAGPGTVEYQKELEEMARTLGIRERIVFTGMLRGRERIQALVDADIFVLASQQENFGIAVVEALAAGCPVVISDQVNIHREIAAAGVGAVVPLDVEAWAKELSRWMSDEALRRKAGEAGRIWARSQFDHHAIARRWEDIYVGIGV